MKQGDLSGLALASAERALKSRDPIGALEWLDGVPQAIRPPELEAEAAYRAAKLKAAEQRWGIAEDLLRRSEAALSSPLTQQRLGLIRRRSDVMGDRKWDLLQSKIDPAVRLEPHAFQPDVQSAYCCGAYYSRGGRSGAPWTHFLRMAKSPPQDDGERQAISSIATRYIARFLVERTDLMSDVDVVVSVPANVGRYVDRGWSFPDELARGLEACLGLPFIFDGLHMQGDVELKGLRRWERRQAIRGAIRAGDLGPGNGRHVLVIDDVITSGATMREAARVLTAAGAATVSGLAMSHTEG